MRRQVAIGLGCRKGCPAQAVVDIVRRALESAVDADPIALFTTAQKRGEPGLSEAAARLKLELHFFPREALGARAGDALTHSPRVEAQFGVPSVAETSALAGAGPGSILLAPRIAGEGVACALALRESAG